MDMDPTRVMEQLRQNPTMFEQMMRDPEAMQAFAQQFGGAPPTFGSDDESRVEPDISNKKGTVSLQDPELVDRLLTAAEEAKSRGNESFKVALQACLTPSHARCYRPDAYACGIFK